MSISISSVKIPSKEEFEIILEQIRESISAIPDGDKPRVVGVHLAQNSSTIRTFLPYLVSENLALAAIYSITDLWDDSREEQLNYYLEIFEEFKHGLTFLNEAISYPG